MIDAWIDKSSYRVGEELQIFLDFSSNEDLLEGRANINAQIFRIKKERNQLADAFGYLYERVEDAITIKRTIPDSCKEGLYLVEGLKLISADGQGQPYPFTPRDLTKLFFWVSADQKLELSASELTEKINQLDAERANYNNAVIATEAAMDVTESARYKVLIFGVGCLIHTSQNVEGYALHPLGRGFSYKHMLDAVNTYTASKYEIRLPEEERIGISFSNATPLFVIDFANVKAINQDDAENHCLRESEKIFTILAYDRDQRPNSFAIVSFDPTTRDGWQRFHFPGYRGNLIPDFNPTSPAETLDRLLPKLDTSPWLDLIMRLYADARSEENYNYMCLKFWAILEMISEERVKDKKIALTSPNGNKIRDYGGKIVTTEKKLGRVYKYAFDLKIPPTQMNSGKLIFETYLDATAHPSYDGQTKIVSL